MLTDESDLSVARGVPAQRLTSPPPTHENVTQPKHAGYSLCDGKFS